MKVVESPRHITINSITALKKNFYISSRILSKFSSKYLLESPILILSSIINH